MTELLEASIAIGTLIWFFARMDPDVLDQLMVAAERFQALLTLMRLDLRPPGQLPVHVHLHGRFVHEDLQQKQEKHCRQLLMYVRCSVCVCVAVCFYFVVHKTK